MKAQLLAFTIGSALSLLGANPPRDLYVSINGTMFDRYGNLIENVSTDLGAVLRTAQTGDTVWIEDGYVWEGVMENEPTKDTAYCRNALVVTKAVTIRSVSGIYDEAKDLGVTIKGQWAVPGETALGANAVRCMRTSASVTLRGIIFENGATDTGNQYRGGAAVYSGSGGQLYDCLIRNCQSGTGSAVRGAGINTILTRCVVTNCKATAANTSVEVKGGTVYNASAYDCFFEGNTSPNGGAIVGGGDPYVISNCVFTGNMAGTRSTYCGGGAIVGDNLLVLKCAFTNNVAKTVGGAIYGNGLTVCKCTFSGNLASGGSDKGDGGAICCDAASVIERCTFVGNVGTNENMTASGGALYCGWAKRCSFFDNSVSGRGGAAYGAVLVDCTVDGNSAKSKQSNNGYGGGLNGCTATNCTIVNNFTTKGHNYSARGGGAYNCDLVYCSVSNNVAEGLGGGCFQPNATRIIERCLFVGNKGGTGGPATMGPAGGVAGVAGSEPTLVHCTLTDNKGRGVYNVNFEDCISWGNGENDANIISAVRSCSSVLTDEMGEGNVTENPKLRTKPAGYAYWPANSKCYNMGRFDAYGIGLMLLLR